MTPHPLADRIARLIQEWRASIHDPQFDSVEIHAAYEGARRVCADELEEALAQGVPPSPGTEAHYAAERRCCSICDAKKVCHVCGTPTLFACSDCRLDFGATIYVCQQTACRVEHEAKCSARLRESAQQKPSGVPPASAPDSMTAEMKQRAAIAEQIFVKRPHPEDEPAVDPPVPSE